MNTLRDLAKAIAGLNWPEDSLPGGKLPIVTEILSKLPKSWAIRILLDVFEAKDFESQYPTDVKSPYEFKNKQYDESLTTLILSNAGNISTEALEDTVVEMDRTIQTLLKWKESAINVTPDMQAIGKAMGLNIGESVHDKILPYIQQVTALAADLIRLSYYQDPGPEVYEIILRLKAVVPVNSPAKGPFDEKRLAFLKHLNRLDIEPPDILRYFSEWLDKEYAKEDQYRSGSYQTEQLKNFQ